MPNPTNIFTALAENLRQVGITVNPVAQPFFGRPKPEFGCDNPELFAARTAADATVGEEAHAAAYEQVTEQIMEYLPAVPISHSPPALVVREGVEGLIPSPLTDERFATVSVS